MPVFETAVYLGVVVVVGVLTAHVSSGHLRGRVNQYFGIGLSFALALGAMVVTGTVINFLG